MAPSSIAQRGESCALCDQPWHRSGGHQLASLRCGHLFGRCCILTHLKSRRDCPLCRAAAAPAQVWPLYLANEAQPDAAQQSGRLADLRRELERERELGGRAESRRDAAHAEVAELRGGLAR